MSFFSEVKISPKDFTGDAGGRLRTSNLTTLFDGKTLNQDDTDLWDNKGTGTFTFNQNKMNMSVTAGQYCVRTGKIIAPYFSGKSQIAETTFDNFGVEANVVKRVGYFSSSATAPYTANLDGVFLENDGTTIRLKVLNNGVEKLNIAWTDWDKYALISTYDWNNFTVDAIDFLWLGGAVLRVNLAINGEFLTVHTFKYAGSSTDVFMKTPNHPIRYEIRSTTGTGIMNAICSQIATEGSTNESGKSFSVRNEIEVTTNSIGTAYALLGVRKASAFKDISTAISEIGVSNTNSSDAGVLELRKNPTVAGTFTYSTNRRIESAIGVSANTVTGGEVITTLTAGTFGGTIALKQNFQSLLNIGLDNVADELVLVYRPITNIQGVYGYLNLKSF